MTEFRTAEGTCNVSDAILNIDRPDTRQGRWWMRIRRFTEQHPGRAFTYVVVVGVLLELVLTILVVYLGGVAAAIEVWDEVIQSVIFPAIVIGSIVSGIGYGIGFLKGRRVKRREGIETFARPESISLDGVTRVISITPVGTETLYIFYKGLDDEKATPIIFMWGMADETEKAKELFKNHGIPIESCN